MNSQHNAKTPRTSRWSPLMAMALPALLVLAFDPQAAEAGSPRSKPSSKSPAPQSKSKPSSGESKLSVRKAVNQIDGLTVEELDDGTTILRLHGNVEPTFNVYRLSDPDRLVVDIASSERGKAVPHVPVDSWAVGRVTISSVEEHDSKLARVVVNLKRESSYIVVPKGQDLAVTITPKEVAPEAYFARKSAGARKAEIQQLEAAAAAKASDAENKASSAEAKASSAEGRAADAELRAKQAAQKAAEAQSEAERIRAEAEKVKAKAEKEAAKLQAAAEAEAAKLQAAAEADAAKVEAAARKRAKQLEDDARDRAEKLEGDARDEAKKLATEANDALAEARRLAQARAEKLAEAEALAVEAEREANQAEERATRARTEAEAAEAYATEVRSSAELKAKRAEELLAEAETAMTNAQADTDKAKQSRLEAESALEEARKAARKTGKRDKQRGELERAVKQAEEAAKAAKEREEQAKTELAELARDRDTLQQALEDKRSEADGLRKQLDDNAELARAQADAQREYDQAQARYTALGGEEGPKNRSDRREHRQAKHELTKAEGQLAKLHEQIAGDQARLEELQGEIAEAREALQETLTAHKQQRSLKRQWEEERKAAGDAAVRDVRFVDGPDGAAVVVELDGPVIYDASSLTPNMSMLELRNASIPAGLERSLDTTSFAGPIDRITSFREGDDVKIIVASAGSDPASIELDRKSNRLIWKFPGGRVLPAEVDADNGADNAVAAAKRAAPTRVETHPGADELIERSEVVSLGGTKVSGFSTPPVLAARPGTKVGSRNRWRGERIDIELQDAPIKDVLLLFSDIGKVNIIAGPEVQGSVTMKLSAVPWDQALDIILRSLNLGMVQEGNVIRVATQANLEEERRKAIEEANAQVQLKPLETRLIPLSYATVADMLPKVQSVLSTRGTVTPDSRTNTLIIMDVAENIALAESLVRQLDSQTPQVLIEARIVEARTNWLRQLGIQWGFDFISSPGTGNPTGLLFPNSMGIAGGSGSNQSPVRGLILPGAAANPNYAVDLPAPVSTG
ncbi:MAG: AMIN domain-containing protein, partial [Myxococcales bacterium]|nr:AMIN domain-containing protein [Myxococcales bacterium]